MKTQNLEPNTSEWEEWRRQGIGASDSPIILGLSSYTTPFQLWQEKLGLIKREQNEYITQKGHMMEPKARALYELDNDVADFSPMLAEHADHPWLRASFDGLSLERKKAIEIKFVGKDKHEDAKLGRVPAVYYPQLQHQLFVSGVESVDYVSYNGVDIAVVNVLPDMEFLKNWWLKVCTFRENVVGKTPPALVDQDFSKLKRTEKELKSVLEEYEITVWREEKLREDILKLVKQDLTQFKNFRIYKQEAKIVASKNEKRSP